jgi:hypothetical protein
MDLALDERETGNIEPERAAELLCGAAGRAPARAVSLDPELVRWLARMRWLLGLRPDLADAFGVAGAPVPPPNDIVAEAAGPLLPWIMDRLRPLCAGRRSLAELREAPVRETLQASLPGSVIVALASLAPERVPLPSGRVARLEYRPAEPPVLAARLQEFFGSTRTPRVGGGRVPVLLHLLAPSLRPVQVTSDLASFWVAVYPKIRAELRRRYPRHAWPDDPLTASPEHRPRLRGTKEGG